MGLSLRFLDLGVAGASGGSVLFCRVIRVYLVVVPLLF